MKNELFEIYDAKAGDVLVLDEPAEVIYADLLGNQKVGVVHPNPTGQNILTIVETISASDFARLLVGANFCDQDQMVIAIPKNINELTQNLISFWDTNNLGNIEIQSIKPLIIQSYDCFECEDLPHLGKPACAFDSGLLEGIFSNYYGKKVEAEETKCYAQGDNFCQFVVKPVQTNE